MPLHRYENGRWRKETKEEMLRKEDIEGKHPCEQCWKQARDNGIYVWPLLPAFLKKAKRCPSCNRIV